jgi:hypothetical protein
MRGEARPEGDGGAGGGGAGDEAHMSSPPRSPATTPRAHAAPASPSDVPSPGTAHAQRSGAALTAPRLLCAAARGVRRPN